MLGISANVGRVECRLALRQIGVRALLTVGLLPFGVAPAAADDWPQWRGPARSAISAETGLLRDWPSAGPPLLWKREGLGTGYASVVVAGGRIYTMGARDGVGALIALDERDGSEIWRTPVGPGNPNSTPTSDGPWVFALGLGGDLVCARSDDGQVVWSRNLPREFGGSIMSNLGYCESVLIDGDRLVCTPGAQQAALVGLDKRSGATEFQAALPADVGARGKAGAGYASAVVSTAAGVRQYVQFVGRCLLGVSARSGQTLWTYNRVATEHANVSTPILRGDYVFVSACYGGGSALLQVLREGGRVTVKEKYYLAPKVLENHHGGMVMVGDYLYAGTGFNKGFPVCLAWKTGKVMWRPGRGPGLGSAALVCADGHLYFRYENGTMALIEARPDKYTVRAKFVEPSNLGKAWAYPVIANGRLYLRDQDVLCCYDLKP